MIKVIRNFFSLVIGGFLYYTGFVKNSIKEIDKKKPITSIYFHKPTLIFFESVILWLLKNNYTFISSDELYKILNGKKKSNTKLIHISLDDGWLCNYDNIAPIISKYKIPITIFITTKAIEDGYFWWELVNASDNAYSVKQLINSSDDFRVEVLNEINIKKRDRHALTLEKLLILAKNPLITIGSHSVSHPLLTKCSEQKVSSELINSKVKLEGWLNYEVDYLSYPNGSFNDRIKTLAGDAGYKMAFTTEAKFINEDKTNVDYFCIPRFSANENGSKYESFARIVGIWQPFFNKIRLKL